MAHDHREGAADPVEIRIEAPRGTDPIDIARAVVGPHVLLKAEHTHGWRTKPFSGRWKALNTAYKMAIDSYEALLEKMIAHIAKYAREEAGLKKAMSPRPLLTPKQIAEIAQIIRDYHTAFVISIAPDTVNEAEVKRLVSAGILPPETLTIIKDSYLYGQIVSSVRAYDDAKKREGFTYEAFKRRVEKKSPPLTSQEKAAIAWAEHSAAIHVTGLGNRVADDFSTIAIEADGELRRKYEKIIRDEVKEGVERREAWRKVGSEIGHATTDWARDLGRIAATEMQKAHQEGVSGALKKREGDPENIRVAKIPSPDACKHCVRLHLLGGHGSAPRIFPLSQLEQNGTNVGRKAADWKATVGPVHPWCACELVHVPPGWGFETEPPKGEGWQKKGKRWSREKPNPSRAYNAPKTIEEFWIPQLVPDALRLSEGALERDLRKGLVFTYGDSVPESGVVLRIGDPSTLAAVNKVIEATPAHLFDKKIGITLITTDIARTGSALEDHDLAYWTGNEIRLSQTISPDRIDYVLKHEIGHSLNIYLMNKLGSVEKLRSWHKKLFKLAKKEGFVSDYAKKLPIENAAEVTRLYLYDRPHLMLNYPRQFTFAHDAYKDIIRPPKQKA